jgi:hypothetical protein
VNLCYLPLLLALLTGASLSAQTSTLRGHVRDQSGAVVPAAQVNLTAADGVRKTTTADNFGVYSFTGLPLGTYMTQASAPDMAQPEPSRVVLKTGQQTLDLLLRIASKLQQVTVQENQGPVLSTDPGGNAGALTLRGDDLQALADDPDELMADLQALAGPSAGPNGGSIFIDGFSGGDLPSKESIREIRINNNPFSPEYDKLGYGRIEIFTKPGTDRYHATVNYNNGNQYWNSRNPYSAQKAPFLLNEFEVDASGPLSKRASFTVDAQRNMVDNGAITNAVTLDPHTLAVVPFNSVVTSPQRFIKVSPRVDYQLNDSHTLMFRYGVTHADIPDAGIGAFDLTTRGYHSSYTNQTVQLADTAVLGSSVNETRFQYYRNAFQTTANTIGPLIQVPSRYWAPSAEVARYPATLSTRKTASNCRITLPFSMALTPGGSASVCARNWRTILRRRISMEPSRLAAGTCNRSSMPVTSPN